MYLGLDLGSSSIKVAVVDADATLSWVGETSYEISIVDDRAEIDPELWWTACTEVLSRAPHELLGQVEAIGLAGQMHALLVVGADNAPLRNAMLWPDRRASAEADEFERIEAARPGSLGNPSGPGMPGPMLLWLRENEPAVWPMIHGIVSAKDWLRSRVTSETPIVTDASDASATLMYDVGERDWSNDARALLGLDRSQLPELVASDAIAGHVSDRAADLLGVRAGVTVAVGAGDAAAAMVGLGLGLPGVVVVNVGTGGQALSAVGEPRPELTLAGFQQYRTAGPGTDWYAMAGVLNAGLALSWVRRILGMDWGQLYGHAATALIRSIDDPTFVPFLVGERDPEVGRDGRGAWVGLTAAHDRAALARSALVGVGSYLARRTRLLADLTGADKAVLAGGSTRNGGWAQLLTTMIGKEVELSADGHASVRGAAILGARSCGHTVVDTAIRTELEPDVSLIGIAEDCMARLRHLQSSQVLLAEGQKYA